MVHPSRSHETTGGAPEAKSSRVPNARPRALALASRFAPSMLSVAALSVLLLLPGCGKESRVSGSSESRSVATVAEHTGSNVSAQNASAVMERPVESVGSMNPDATGSLPPDIVVSVPDTAVTPGDAVEVTVQGTSDVTEVSLWDGLNDRQALAYDARANLWRTTYRVPIQPARERWGVSVTAKTQANRWRRVWVFFTQIREAPSLAPTATAPDS